MIKKICVLLVALIFCVNIYVADASEYVGEFCWDGSITLGGGTPGDMRLGISLIGDTHYSAYGSLSSITPLGSHFGLINGSAEFVVDHFELLLGFVTTDTNFGYTASNSMKVILDNQFNGTVTGVSVGNASVLGGSDIEIFTGNLTFKQCNQP